MPFTNKTYSDITSRVITDLENGTAPWQKPWSAGSHDGSTPYNAVSGRPYSGLNIILLWGSSVTYGSNAWMTYKQAIDCGGHVRKGERGTKIIFWKMLDKKTGESNTDGSDKIKRIPLLKTYTVFNVEQCEGVEFKKPEPVDIPLEVDQVTTAIQKMVKVNVNNSDRAFYQPSADAITMPKPEQFKRHVDYTSVLLHEATHATGHKSRLDRDLNGWFGTESYAAEELIAEMGSAFLCGMIGHDFNPQHSSYLKSWLKVLKNDDRAIFRAASAAQKAADFVLEYLQIETAEQIDNA